MGWLAQINSWSEAWASWMFPVSLQVAVLTAIVWLLTRICDRYLPASIAVLMWSVVFLKLVIPPNFEAPWSIGHMTDGLLSAEGLQRGNTSSDPIPVASNTDGAETFVASGTTSIQLSLTGTLMIAWGMIALSLLAYALYQYRQYSRRIRSDLRTPPEALQTALEGWLSKTGMPNEILVRLSSAVNTPGVFGFAHPVILFPIDYAERYSEQTISAVMGHELAHIKRSDLLTGWLMGLMACLYWFHPAVWVATVYTRRAREMACDDMVLERGAMDGGDYVKTIVNVVEGSRGARAPGAGFLGILEGGDDLVARVRSATALRRARKFSWFGLALVVFVAAALLPMGASPSAAVVAPRASEPVDETNLFAQQGAPQIVSITPAVGSHDVDPSITEIRVVFDRDMAAGFSWTGGGPSFPQTNGKPKWVDTRTCVLPVTLESGQSYRLGINSQSYKNFKSAQGVPAPVTPIYFHTSGGSTPAADTFAAPKVISMTPQNRSVNVSPSTTELVVVFDRPMDAGFSWVKTDGIFPDTSSKPVWSVDRRTCTLRVQLKPGTRYKLGLNNAKFTNFMSAKGVPLEPVVWTFSTGN